MVARCTKNCTYGDYGQCIPTDCYEEGRKNKVRQYCQMQLSDTHLVVIDTGSDTRDGPFCVPNPVVIDST